MCECVIKLRYNKPPIVHVFILSLIQFIKIFLYNCPTIGQLITSCFKFSIVALQVEGTQLHARVSPQTLVTTGNNY